MTDQYKIAILKTLAYFELFEMPLNAFEVYRYLYWPHREKVEKKEVKDALKSLEKAGDLFIHENYYYLGSDMKERLGVRKVRQKRSREWMQRAKPWLKVLAAWPGVEMIAICNNLAFLSAREESDIDLFIVTKPGRLWQTRFFLAAFLQMFKKRTTPDSGDAEKFCLSFFVSSDALDLSSVRLEGEDIYLAYWVASLVPVYDPMNRMHDVMTQNHHLIAPITRSKPENFCTIWSISETTISFRLLELFTNQTSWFTQWLEKKTRAWQEKHFSKEIKDALEKQNSFVIANSQMLKFHTNDRRQKFLERWKKRYETLF